MKTLINVHELKAMCPLPKLMALIGFRDYVAIHCNSPFRQDTNKSWSVSKSAGRWMYKDAGTGEVGDEIGFLAHLYGYDAQEDFSRLQEIYLSVIKNGKLPRRKHVNLSHGPDFRGFTNGDENQMEQLLQITAANQITRQGLEHARRLGTLVFGSWQGYQVYAVTDKSRRVIQVQRINGKLFPASGRFPERDVHTLPNSILNWPVGSIEAKECQRIALVVGMNDFLAIHDRIIKEERSGVVAPVGMLSAASIITPDALGHFRGKHVRLFPHSDQDSLQMADRWQKQLANAGATKVDIFNFSAFQQKEVSDVKNLRDFNRWQELGNNQNVMGGILP